MTDLPTCPTCGRPVALAVNVGDGPVAQPCGHRLPGALR